MNVFSNIIKTFYNTEECSQDAVIEVNTSNYAHFPVIARDGCLCLFSPTSSNKHELLLQIPVEDSLNKAFSLFRLNDCAEAEVRFFVCKDVLIPLVNAIPREVLNRAALQKICDCMRLHSSWTVAHVAAHFKYCSAFTDIEVVKFLNTQEIVLYETPLHLALQHNDENFIKTLLDLGASVDTVDSQGNSIFHLVANTNRRIIEIVTKKPSKLLNKHNLVGRTPLHIACERDKPKCVHALLSAGADVNIPSTHDGPLPIHLAAAYSPCSVEEILSVYPNQLNAEDMKDGGTPLHWANSRQVINALIELRCNLNAKNFHGKTALHKKVEQDKLPCVIALLSHGADVNAQDKDNNTPMHFAISPSVLQALLVFGADPGLANLKNGTVRHTIATGNSKEMARMLYILHAVGAARCLSVTAACNDGCCPKGNFDGTPAALNTTLRSRTNFDEFLDKAMFTEVFSDTIGFANVSKSGGRILTLDGGGMKGLVLIQLLIAIEEATKCPISHTFDWIAGTSTGAIVALAMALGKTPRESQQLYFRIKDEVFVGVRPYDEKPLEIILKEEFGTETTMAKILGPKFPADLHIFRNYQSAEDLVQSSVGHQKFDLPKSPERQLVWEVARSSGAAPSYFKSYEQYIDGGLIANNPTLDVITEIAEYNAALSYIGRGDEVVKPSVIVSLGTGKPPVLKVEVPDMTIPEGFLGKLMAVQKFKALLSLLIDQATMADNRTVDRARAWCFMCGVTYFRLSPQLSADIQLDETRDEVLINMLWETMVYIRKKDLSKLIRLLVRHN